MSWETTLNDSFQENFQLYKIHNEKINILHECREFKNLDRLLKILIKRKLMKMKIKKKKKIFFIHNKLKT
jgi:hypothetical protein